MPDINKPILEPHTGDPEVQDRMVDIEDWSEETAMNIARSLGIDLQEEHWQVVRFLRSHYRAHGKLDSARKLADALDDAFQEQGGSKFLHRLFPEGPVAQGTRIAGVPTPTYSADKGFGSSI